VLDLPVETRGNRSLTQTFDFQPKRGTYAEDFWILYYEHVQKWFRDASGIAPVTISTEGGVHCPHHMRDLTFPVEAGFVIDERGRSP
jgi:hypothetical protein